MTQISKPPHKTVCRAQYIDITRVIAAFIIVLFHAFYLQEEANYIRFLFLESRVAFFYMLSGYFARRFDFESIRKRFLILFIPFLIWSVIPVLLILRHAPSEEWIRIIEKSFYDTLLGFPPNVPLWFLRNLILLSILVPIFKYFEKYAAAVGLIVLFICSYKLDPMQNITINNAQPQFFSNLTLSIGFFLLGFGLHHFTILDLSIFLERWWKLILILCLSINIPIWGALFYGIDIPTIPVCMLLGIAALLSSGYFVNKCMPKLSQLLGPASNATYLIFLCHYPLYSLIYQYSAYFIGSENLANYKFLANFVITCFIVIACTYSIKLMRAYCPVLLPYIAGVKR